MVELADSPEVDKLVTRMREWVKKTAGKGLLKDGTPAPTVYPDYEQDMYPTPPPLIGLRVVEMQKILRLEFTLLWGKCWQGGCGRFPWELICANLDEFIPPERRPVDAKLGDPSNLRSSVILTWLEYFTACQDPAFSAGQRIQFSKVFAGLSPIDASLSQESSRRLEFIPSQNREAWVIFFTETVTRCHAPNGLEYPPESIAYAKHVRNSATQVAVAALLTKNVDPLDLPVGTGHPKAVIFGQEKEIVLKWAEQLPEDYRRFVIELVDAVNEFQAHLPATTPYGIWVGQYLNSMPALLPSSPESLIEGLQYFIHFWLPIGYFSPSINADLTSRYRYFQLYFEDMLASPLICHTASKTLLGGYNGVVWLVRALILLVFNFAAVKGDLTPPCDPPSNCDITSLPLDELPNILGYCQDLLEAIRESTSTLSQSSGPRMAETGGSAPVLSQGPVAVPASQPSPSAPAPLPSPAVPISALSTTPHPDANAPKPRHRSSKKGIRKKRADTHQEPEELGLESSGSDQSSDEQDYNQMDPHSDDEDDLDPDGFSRDLVNVLDEDNYSEDHRSQSHEATVLPHLPDECAKAVYSSLSGPTQGHVFGPVLTLPPAPQQPLPRSYEPLYTNLNVAVTKIKATLCGWNELAKVNSIGLDQDTDIVQAAARELPAPLQPLAHFVLARTCAWKRAERSAPHVIDFVPRLALDARTALQLDVAVTQFLEEEGRRSTVGDAEYDALIKLHRQLLTGAIELCWVYKEILAFERLASEWSERMPLNWLVTDDCLPTNGPALYNLAHPLVEWANTASKLDGDLRAQRRVMWRSTSQPFEVKHNVPLWYWFGNPRPDEMPDGFEACMRAIESLVDEDHDAGPSNSPSMDPPATSAGRSKRSAATQRTSGPLISVSNVSGSPASTSNDAPLPSRTLRSAAQATQATVLEPRGVTLRSRRSTRGEQAAADGSAKRRRR